MTVYKTAREEILKDWQANLQDFASEHEFPVEATESLQDALEIIGADDRLYAIFRTWEENYWKDLQIYAGASFYHRNQQTHQRTL